jgi:hypothetical protein
MLWTVVINYFLITFMFKLITLPCWSMQDKSMDVLHFDFIS